MRYHLILPFIGYLFRKMFSGVFKLNRKYRREMESNPGLAVFIGIICSILFVLGTTLISSCFLSDGYDVRSVAIASCAGSVIYIVFTFFNIQFNNFLEERQELFDVIKDDRPRSRGIR